MKKFILGLITGAVIMILPITFASILPPKEFTDVPQGNWFYEPVTNLADMGIIDGYNDGSFRPLNNVSRAEVAKLLYGIYERLDNSAKVNSLETDLAILQAKVSTLDFPGTCYYNDQWYNQGDSVGYCTCKEDGSLECPQPEL